VKENICNSIQIDEDCNVSPVMGEFSFCRKIGEEELLNDFQEPFVYFANRSPDGPDPVSPLSPSVS
jgi:hypothetical protein